MSGADVVRHAASDIGDASRSADSSSATWLIDVLGRSFLGDVGLQLSHPAGQSGCG